MLSPHRGGTMCVRRRSATLLTRLPAAASIGGVADCHYRRRHVRRSSDAGRGVKGDGTLDQARGLTKGLGTLYEQVFTNRRMFELQQQQQQRVEQPIPGQRGSGGQLRLVTIPLERLTRPAFAPFGSVYPNPSGVRTVDDDSDPANATSASHVPGMFTTWPVNFRADSAGQILFIRYHDNPAAFSAMERHFHVSQVCTSSARRARHTARAAGACQLKRAGVRTGLHTHRATRAQHYGGRAAHYFGPR
jgi:hypothetical protein